MKTVRYQFVMRGEGGHILERSELLESPEDDDLANEFADWVTMKVVSVGDTFSIERVE